MNLAEIRRKAQAEAQNPPGRAPQVQATPQPQAPQPQAPQVEAPKFQAPAAQPLAAPENPAPAEVAAAEVAPAVKAAAVDPFAALIAEVAATSPDTVESDTPAADTRAAQPAAAPEAPAMPAPEEQTAAESKTAPGAEAAPNVKAAPQTDAVPPADAAPPAASAPEDKPAPAPAPAPASAPAPAPQRQTAPAPALREERNWLEEIDEPETDPAPAWQEPQDLPMLVESEGAPGFDPATVILRGRESASSEEVVQETEQSEATLELLCFKVASEEYAISIMDIKEIIRPREVTEVPRVPPFVRGILSLRGIIIPVFDMRLRLGLPAGQRSEKERIIVVKRQGGFCGVLVDQVVQVVRIAEAGVEAPPVVLEGIDREFIQGIGRVAGRMLILLDMEKVLDVGLL